MKIVIDISEYDKEWIGNAYSIPQDINTKIAEAIINAEPCQLEQHWIPVTERLPEKSGRYYVTEWVYHIDDKKHEGKHTKRVNFAEYSATEKKWRRVQALVVVAWMDNEPYKGVTE